MSETIKAFVRHCARCGQDHDEIEYRQLANPIIDSDGSLWEWWGPCPVNGAPILMRMYSVDVAEEGESNDVPVQD